MGGVGFSEITDDINLHNSCSIFFEFENQTLCFRLSQYMIKAA